MWRWALASIALILGACGDTGEQAARPSPSPPPPAAVHARFDASDGRPVRGIFHPAASGDAPAVVLVNGLVGGMGQWDVLVPALRSAGFASLTFDGRGGVDEEQLVKEVSGAVAFLRSRDDVDGTRVALVGSSVGASTAVLAMTRGIGRDLGAAVALSPPAAPAFARQPYHPHDVLFLSDFRERATVTPLLRGAVRSRQLESEANGHGVSLLRNEYLRQAVLDWLTDHLG